MGGGSMVEPCPGRGSNGRTMPWAGVQWMNHAFDGLFADVTKDEEEGA